MTQVNNRDDEENTTQSALLWTCPDPTKVTTISNHLVSQLSFGEDHCLFLTLGSSRVFSFGKGDRGQLGLGSTQDHLREPQQVTNLSDDIVEIVAGAYFSAALTQDGTLFMWGDNSQGQCGVDADLDVIVHPTKVNFSDKSLSCDICSSSISEGTLITRVSCGRSHSLALSTTNELWTWGLRSPIPTKVDLAKHQKVLSISCGADFNVAVLEVINSPDNDSSSEAGGLSCDKCKGNKANHSKQLSTVCPLGLPLKEVATENNLDTLPVDPTPQEKLEARDENTLDHSTSGKIGSMSNNEFTPSEHTKHPLNTNSIDVELAKTAENTECSKLSLSTERTPDDTLSTKSLDENTETKDDFKNNVEVSNKSSENAAGNEPLFTEQEKAILRRKDTATIKASRSSSFLDTTSAKEFLMRQLSGYNFGMDSAHSTLSTNQQNKPSDGTKVEDPESFVATAETNIVYVKDLVKKTMDKFSISQLRHSLSTYSSQDGSQSSQESFEVLEMNSNGNNFNIPPYDKQLRCVSVARQIWRLKKQKEQTDAPGSVDSSNQAFPSFTEVWTWGKGNGGVLGHADEVDRPKPTKVAALSGQKVVRVVAGASHVLALTADCRVFSWGNNAHGQLGHSLTSTMVATPHILEIPSFLQIWDMVAGNTHTLLLADLQTSHVAIYECGVHSCEPKEDCQCPKQAKAIHQLNMVKKSGLITRIFAGGPHSGCLVDHSRGTGRISALHEFAASERRHLHHLQTILGRVLGPLLKDASPEWEGILGELTAQWADLIDLVSINAYELTLLVQQQSTGKASIESFHLIDPNNLQDWLEAHLSYFHTLGNLIATGGLQTLSQFCTLPLRLISKDAFGEMDHKGPSDLFLFFLQLPLRRVSDYIHLMGRLSSAFDSQLESTRKSDGLHLATTHWRHLLEVSSRELQLAESTWTFWGNAPQKLVDALKKPERRVIRESKHYPLNLSSTGRFVSHYFILFNDIFVHSHFGGFETYSLSTLWVDHQQDNNSTNCFTLTTPEEVLVFSCSSATEKTEWVCALNQTIRQHLNSGSNELRLEASINPATSHPPLSPPLARHATHTFQKPGSLRGSTYTGMWLRGKLHGYGDLTMPDGRHYSGKFKANLQHGDGTLEIPHPEGGSPTVYEGLFKEGKLTGYGKITYHNGDVYEGYFKNGLRHGHGMLKQGQFPAAAAKLYIGEWREDKKEGYGVLDNIKSGEKYMGMWHENMKHGSGMVVTIDGVYYEGNFVMDKLSGPGVMIFEDNTCFEGELGSSGMLNGKGTLHLSNGDQIEGNFSGVWSQGIKVSGIYNKSTVRSPNSVEPFPQADPVKANISMFGKHCVPADQKWEDLFAHCCHQLNITGDPKADTSRAWDAIAVAMTKTQKHQRLPKKKWQHFKGDLLERIPAQMAAGQQTKELRLQDFEEIQRYVATACDWPFHPLGQLVEGLVDVYRATYLGVGAHPRLLPHAVEEIHSFVARLYAIIRVLFPNLPKPGTLLRLFSLEEPPPVEMEYAYQEQENLVVSANRLLHPILLPRLYPPLFTLYALYNERSDEHYWEKLLRWNKQSDVALLGFLGVNPKFWPFPYSQEIGKNAHKRLSEIKDQCFTKAIETLQHISTAFTALDKLKVIHQTFHEINKVVTPRLAANFLWTMDDLFPLFQYTVVRARIRHLGSEIHLVQDLMEPHLENGELGIMFTTLKACYFQIKTEKVIYS